MDLLIILTYTALCVGIFKLFKIPLNKWSVPTAVLGGVVIITAIMLVMNYNHPYAKFGKDAFTTIPIVPQITGTVATVNVVPNQLVKQGDILFTLDSTEQRIALAKAKAALEEAKQGSLDDYAALQVATSKVKQAEAEVNSRRDEYERYARARELGGENSPVTEAEVENRLNRLLAGEASLASAIADEERIRINTETKFNGVDVNVAQLLAAVEKAELDLERTIIRAPVDGQPTIVALRPGYRATNLPLRPSMTFVPKEKRRFGAVFFQNSLGRMKKGLPAEVIFDAVPGHVFKGTLVDILPAMAEGEYQADGSLVSAQRLMTHGFAIGVIELEEDLDDYNLPLGVQGQAVVFNYDHDYVHVSMVRRILLRMMAWLKYVYPIK
ncbi:HlyD family secretion protein [Thalassotalea agarivorans]|uniref:Multidrug resistance efflux pump n=1 Tax=Thalassotalea agarivorans TaxID=349064 RepID=A0A1I0ETQ9_THASX|nr:HlyD family secretion protein [Thalassotalea agarivorans]SET47984.1 Multidrug resistance efflux pump [Thalassotalea agarivorans]